MADLAALRAAIEAYLRQPALTVLNEHATDSSFVVSVEVNGTRPLRANIVGRSGSDVLTFVHTVKLTAANLAVVPLPKPEQRMQRFENAVDAIAIARAGLVHARVDRTGDGEGCEVTIAALVYADGLNKQTFMSALTEVGKARMHLSQVLGAFAELRASEAAQPPWAVPQVAASTYVVGPQGTNAWTTPDLSGPMVASLAPGSRVTVTERRGAWAKVTTENGWEGWVDGRVLQPAP